ncbi:hypothetical protein PGT21_011439 [Puccinia graminis f. sp. tritici]|uniref:Uncharacterized protein n=1 Tax=Puccinia graminis f. sp. tritici TaxID=56615 RepID=A0A5B0LZV5_PUCGR|nr:hypothetical protein PGT21_011439 [Puccinia graminis f. sp. tritici]KAA1089988.1 hypothetical protein PGTUg99_032774 [Puccinia graminis f. sp. tritici]
MATSHWSHSFIFLLIFYLCLWTNVDGQEAKPGILDSGMTFAHKTQAEKSAMEGCDVPVTPMKSSLMIETPKAEPVPSAKENPVSEKKNRFREPEEIHRNPARSNTTENQKRSPKRTGFFAWTRHHLNRFWNWLCRLFTKSTSKDKRTEKWAPQADHEMLQNQKSDTLENIHENGPAPPDGANLENASAGHTAQVSTGEAHSEGDGSETVTPGPGKVQPDPGKNQPGPQKTQPESDPPKVEHHVEHVKNDPEKVKGEAYVFWELTAKKNGISLNAERLALTKTVMDLLFEAIRHGIDSKTAILSSIDPIVREMGFIKKRMVPKGCARLCKKIEENIGRQKAQIREIIGTDHHRSWAQLMQDTNKSAQFEDAFVSTFRECDGLIKSLQDWKYHNESPKRFLLHIEEYTSKLRAKAP